LNRSLPSLFTVVIGWPGLTGLEKKLALVPLFLLPPNQNIVGQFGQGNWLGRAFRFGLPATPLQTRVPAGQPLFL